MNINNKGLNERVKRSLSKYLEELNNLKRVIVIEPRGGYLDDESVVRIYEKNEVGEFKFVMSGSIDDEDIVDYLKVINGE